MGSNFCSSAVLVQTFNATDAYNFITKEANIPVNLVPLFNGVSFLFCCFLKSGVTNKLKSIFKEQKVRVIYSKQDKNSAVVRTLGWSVYEWMATTPTFVLRKE